MITENEQFCDLPTPSIRKNKQQIYYLETKNPQTRDDLSPTFHVDVWSLNVHLTVNFFWLLAEAVFMWEKNAWNTAETIFDGDDNEPPPHLSWAF